jgi:hypothetical protein
MMQVNIGYSQGFIDLSAKFKAGLMPILERETKNTAAVARRLVTKSTAKGRTGLTHGGWNMEKTGPAIWRLWNRFVHATYLEYGTGIYGPFKRWIRPKTAKYLRFPIWAGNTITGWVTTLKTAGMPAQPMIAPNKDKIINDLRIRISNAIKRLSAATGGK